MKKLGICMGIILCMCFVACTNNNETIVDVNKTSLYFQENGIITHKILESFDKEYYSVEELSAAILESIEIYHGDSQTTPPISLERIEQKDDQIYVDMMFLDASYYELFTSTVLFYGTVSDATNLLEYTLPEQMIEATTGNQIMINEIEHLEEKTIIIIDEAIQIMTKASIGYYSEDCISVDANTIDIENSNGFNYIILN